MTLVACKNTLPAGPLTGMPYVACGSCGHYHRQAFRGDCRDDSERFTIDDIEAQHGPGAGDHIEGFLDWEV